MFIETVLLQYRKWFILLLQVFIVLVGFVAAFSVRFDFSVPPEYVPRIISLLLPLLVIKITFFWTMGLFRGWWRYVSMPDLIQIIKANFYGSAVFIAYIVFMYRGELVPRSVLILDSFFCFLGMTGVRFVTRAFRERHLPMAAELIKRQKQILIYGAGTAGQMIVREVRSNNPLSFNIVGFIDDDPGKKRSTFQGLKVLGRRSDIEWVVKLHAIDEIIIAVPSASGEQIRKIVESCRKSNVRSRILPSVEELIDGRVSFQQIRDIDLNDLLGREPIALDEVLISSYLQGKRVLVTGAGGSIGSEICRQVARFNPQKLILFENAETPLFLIEQILVQKYPQLPIVPIIGDVRNRSRINVIFDEQLPQVVFHAAAYKHVPMMEMNPAEAVNNNTQGTRLLSDAADYFGVEKFVLVSTDKAVRPTNVMGASKRVAEMYVQSLNNKSKTNFVTTRFGNVLGSNGSVIPTFKKQISKGGPVTVTHPEVSRFFMTIPEAAQLVLQAGSMGTGGEIYLFDMGKAVKVKTLAEELIRLSGLQPHEDIEIVYTGLRPGEKLYEELLLDDEGVLPTPHNKICVAQSTTLEYAELLVMIECLLDASKALDLPTVKEMLQQLVPEYSPAENKPLAKVIPHPATVINQ